MPPSVNYSRLSEQLKAVADPTRLRILRLLETTDTCESVCNVSELARTLGIPQPTVSHHLKILYNAKIVRCRKMCRDVYYWIDLAAADGVIATLTALYRDSETRTTP